MKTQLLQEVTSAIKNWWVSLILGILFIILAIILMASPIESYATISIVFSIMLFISGILEIIFSVNNRKSLSSWGWYLAGGIIDLILGLFLIMYIELTMTILPFIMAFWLMFRGISAIGFSIDLNSFGVKNWGWILALGILAILCSFLFIWNPIVAAFSIVYLVSFAFIFIGIFRIMLAFEFRKLHKHGKKIKEKINHITDKKE